MNFPKFMLFATFSSNYQDNHKYKALSVLLVSRVNHSVLVRNETFCTVFFGGGCSFCNKCCVGWLFTGVRFLLGFNTQLCIDHTQKDSKLSFFVGFPAFPQSVCELLLLKRFSAFQQIPLVFLEFKHIWFCCFLGLRAHQIKLHCTFPAYPISPDQGVSHSGIHQHRRWDFS